MTTAIAQKISVKTAKLKSMVSAAKNVSRKDERGGLSSLLQLKTFNGELQVVTTDGMGTTLVLRTPEVQGDINILVDCNTFVNLISKITTDLTVIEVDGIKVTIKANGTYTLAGVTESDGSPVDIDIPTFDFSVSGIKTTDTDIKTIAKMSASCRADDKSQADEIFAYYYADNRQVITTDRDRICINPIGIFSKPNCLSAERVAYLGLVPDSKGDIEILESDSMFVAQSTSARLYCTKSAGELVENYPVEAILNAVSSYPHSVIMNKTSLLHCLDRILLFSKEFDALNEIVLTFDKDGVTVSVPDAQSEEKISYVEPSQGLEDTIKTSVKGIKLRTMLSSLLTEEVIMKFGDTLNSLAFESNGIQLLIAPIQK